MPKVNAIEFVTVQDGKPVGRAQLDARGRVRLIDMPPRLADALQMGVIGSTKRGRKMLADGRPFFLACLVQFSRGPVYARIVKDAPVLNMTTLTDRMQQAMDLEWDESLHPRADDGTFAESDGGSRDMPEGRARVDPTERARAILRVAETAAITRQAVPSVKHSVEALANAKALVAQKATTAAILEALGPSAQQQMADLYKAAPEADAALSDALNIVSMTLGPGASIQKGPIKSQQRAIEKVVNKDSGDLGNLRDPVRATIGVNSPTDVHHAVAALSDALEAKGGKIVFADDRFSHPTKTGYRDLQINVRLPNGMVGEVQVNVKAMLAAKNGEGHKYYEELRRIDERSSNSTADIRRMHELIAKSKHLYDDAWKRAGGG